MLNFGDMFFVEDKEYVWLYSDGKTIDAAIILNPEITKQVKALQCSADRKGISFKQPMYCYVELTTEDYINHSANMLGTKNHIELNPGIRPNGKILNKEDLDNIRKEITSSPSLFKESLVNYIESIQ